ncbi:MAG: ribose 5-phosphate isomerase B [Ignavibacteriaceae bacterium]|nr:ribose 5-phosphate isomerase B [Ignavibacteriaceae bacterium]
MVKVITESEVLKVYKSGGRTFPVGENEMLTPLAKDRIKELKIKLVKKTPAPIIEGVIQDPVKSKRTNKVSLGGDHTGFKVKNLISKILVEKGFEIIDVGTYDENACDYPDFAYAASIKVKNGETDFAVLVDATGIPSAITANKIPGIRACTCYNEFSARSAREHNNGNVLVVGAKSLGEETIKSILEVWLNTSFGGERHQKRLDKITTIEKEFSK